MKKIISAVMAVWLLMAAVPYAEALSVTVDGKTAAWGAVLYNSTTYVPLRAASLALCPGAEVSWENGQAAVTTSKLELTARPGSCYINANGRMLFAKDGVKLINGSTMVPVRVLAKATGASVSWDSSAQRVSVKSGSGTIVSGNDFYDSTSLYWLSRIINAESEGEPLNGKIAVGNVILNRVASPDYPNTIYDVIFDKKWGVQFQPAANGTIYNQPTAESILAAKLCLDGASVAGGSMYFLNPEKSESFWIMKNCTYVTTIGSHQFYA